VRRRGIVEEKRYQIGSRSRNQRVAIAHHNRKVQVRHGTNGSLQMEDGPGIDTGDLSAEAGRRNYKVDLVSHERLRSGGGCLFLTKE
jgi:hypothetical protein